METKVIRPRWYTTREVAKMLGFSLSKTKILIAEREIQSLKAGGSRRVLPEWVDDYVAEQARRAGYG